MMGVEGPACRLGVQSGCHCARNSLQGAREDADQRTGWLVRETSGKVQCPEVAGRWREEPDPGLIFEGGDSRSH